MTTTPRQILHLWDFGWCDHDKIIVYPLQNPSDMIKAYLGHESFCSSFVGPNKDFTEDLHGPFLRALISESDFEQISTEQFLYHLNAIRHPPEWKTGVPHEQWDRVMKLACEVTTRNIWCFRLIPNEANHERFHDWGIVLEIFREFLFSNPNTDTIERLIFGYD